MKSLRAWDDVAQKMLYAKPEQFDDMLGYRFDGHFETDKPVYMWFTGLADRNGKEIYENHKVKFRKYMNEYTGVVRFEKGCFIVKWESVVGAYGEKATHSEYLKFCEHIEIIGDLLEG